MARFNTFYQEVYNPGQKSHDKGIVVHRMVSSNDLPEVTVERVVEQAKDVNLAKKKGEVEVYFVDLHKGSFTGLSINPDWVTQADIAKFLSTR